MDWVHNNVGEFDNCQRIVVEKQHIEKLLSDTQIVLNKKTQKIAEEYLPCTVGFFFGSQDYDDYYYQDVEEVRDFCKKTLAEFNFDKDVLQFLAWW
ncbi:MAG: hypothetical protein KGV46_03695 [Pasteurella sp.]|nr:hypothetical protein [Pasteurella sp.]